MVHIVYVIVFIFIHIVYVKFENLIFFRKPSLSIF